MWRTTSLTTVAPVPCGHLSRRSTMSVFKRTGSPVYQYSFYVDGRRFRGSTKTRKITEARAKEAALITKIIDGGTTQDLKPGRAPLLRDFAARFLEWVKGAKLEPATKAYYERGWKL